MTIARAQAHSGEAACTVFDARAAVAPAAAAAPIVIVGNGPVGMRVAQELVQRGCTRAIVIYGGEPYEAYNRVRLSSFLAGEPDWIALTRDVRLPERSVVTQRLGCMVAAIDRERRLVRDAAGETQPYEELVLATGSRPHVPEIPSIGLPGVFTFRDLADAEVLCARRMRSRRTIVLGGGLLGLEAARAMRRFHTEVTVIEHLPRLMPNQLDDAASALLLDHIERMSIRVLLGQAVRAVRGSVRVEGVELRSGEVLPCDTLIVAAGIRPNVELARAAGLSVGRGIRVDDAMRTSDPSIWAVGECAEHRERVYGLVAPGLEQAAVAAHNLLGGSARYTPSVTATRLKVVGLPVFSIGRVGEQDKLDLTRARAWRGEAGAYRKLVTERGRLVGAIAIGDVPELGRLQEAIQGTRRIWPWQAWRFARTGALWPSTAPTAVQAWPAGAAVCNCTGVTRGKLGAAIESGCRSVEALAAATGASTVCGSCRPLLAELLGAAGPRDPVRWHRLLAGVAVAMLLACSVLFLAPGISYPKSVQMPWSWDVLWREGLWKQVSGFTLLGLTVVAAVLSLRKRWRRFSFGGFDQWRALHVSLGLAIVAGLLVHSGGRIGSQLNALLAASYTGLLAVGALAAVVIGREHRLQSANARRLRAAFLWTHILLFWPVPVLLGFHVFKTYYF